MRGGSIEDLAARLGTEASERLREAARRRENRAGWYGWHMHHAELYKRLSREHEAAAEGLIEETDERMSA